MQKSRNFNYLRDLKVGDKFAVIGMEEFFRNLEILAMTEYSIQIKGDTCCDLWKEGDDGKRVPDWKTLGSNCLFSCKTEVVRL